MEMHHLRGAQVVTMYFLTIVNSPCSETLAQFMNCVQLRSVKPSSDDSVKKDDWPACVYLEIERDELLVEDIF